MSAPGRANPTTDVASSTFGGDSRIAVHARVRWSRWSAPAWGAIGATATFLALTCWWLTQDRGIPIFDAGTQLETALEYRSMLASGDLLGPFTFENVYPILGHIVGSVSALIGGMSVAAPIVGENLVFVPLLALGCYQTGRLLFGKLAGMLAVVFVLGSPLMISMFHVFLLDAPLVAAVAVAVWLVLASEDFSRVGVSGLAGLAVGLGLNIKVQFGLFLFGLIVILLLHGGWRNWRGFAVFCAVALLVGTPWYIEHASELPRMIELSSSGPGTPPGNIPPTFTTENLFWYFWSVMNSQLLLPLWVLAAGGTVWLCVNVARDRGRNAVRLEFLAGGFAAWFIATFPDSHHDIRYGMPLLAYVAVAATGWIVSLPRFARVATIALLAFGVGANTLGINFGVGDDVKVNLVASPPPTQQFPEQLVFFQTTGFLASAPSRDGDVPGLLDALRREGVTTVSWSFEQSQLPDFSLEGIKPLVRITGLEKAITESPQYVSSPNVATLLHEAAGARAVPPCTRLSNGTGVWVVRYEAAARKLAFYCPSSRPQYYGVGTVR
ncbi:MAG TPA: glycosyltransferase family 39 protein [Solirubrobacteraceae bacterium]|nr:glycosyltransferase family 39 protein [Solirubrobacteraceae bacterium]